MTQEPAPLPAPARAPRRISLSKRVTLLTAMCVAGAVALVSIGAFFTVYNSMYGQLDDNMRQRAEAALAQQGTVLNFPEGQIPTAFVALADVQFGLLDVRSGRLRTIGKSPPIGNAERGVARGTQQDNIRTDTATDSRVLAVRWDVGQALVIAQPLGPTRDALEKLAVVLILIGGAGIVVAALAGAAVARGGLSPVQRLTSATERVARTGDLRPIPVSGDDELARLSQSFNTMLGAVSESQERQRRLVADAGHELRTPLTSLRTNLELLLAAEQPGAPPLSATDKRDIREDLRAQMDELTQLIGDLVDLAREDARPTEYRRVELVEVVEQALDRARRRASDVDFAVSLEPWALQGDSISLERAVLNLLDNAVKFSPSGGTVRVTLRSAGDGSTMLEVADGGPGIRDEDLPKVFDRFYRSQESRTMPGSGLGLAIVKQAVERHGGVVYAGRAPEGGALFTIRLPGVPG
ncbi:two-component system sensor histidine kinase MprB [Herbihabitans rhizosphaerae]|uniref:histidine kinase n=1 Tax=Herbihabitans rhizosphaerae TaxID=1872711 RepID=A0A4Q7L4W4_9PSEU|nr:HAMP domain-containing sensor histidine kinase [Herbihabitans rhizosphaerae]RZS44678.1 two-component system sensor histidine kinase MprB [Herbihabitans rhizosphaerae]